MFPDSKDSISPTTMQFYAVVGVLALLALHALADESKENAPATAIAANDRSSIVSKLTAANDNSKYSFFQQLYLERNGFPMSFHFFFNVFKYIRVQYNYVSKGIHRIQVEVFLVQIFAYNLIIF